MKTILDRLRHKLHKLGAAAHRLEHGLHVAYLGGVAYGGGYRYVAMGMLLCIVVGWVLHVEGE